MPGEGRSFRRKTAKFWDIWATPPKIAEPRDVLFLDGIYLGRKACILICCDEKNVLCWYLRCDEHAGAWIVLMKRIAEPRRVVSDRGAGIAKALKKVWSKARHADHIVVLRDGTVAEQGTPEALLEKDGIYKHMTELQLQSAEWRMV